MAGGPGRDRMYRAASIIAREAARLAGLWSVQIPPDVLRGIKATDKTATITAGVGPAYPNEVKRVRHPVFGAGRLQASPWSLAHRPHPKWVTNEYRPFLVPAADAKADAAAAEIAKSIDDICHDLGFKGTG